MNCLYIRKYMTITINYKAFGVLCYGSTNFVGAKYFIILLLSVGFSEFGHNIFYYTYTLGAY